MPADPGASASRWPVGDGHAAAKFTVPVAVHVVPRPRLFERLDLGAESPATLVSASAGWGKTLLVSSWSGARDGPVAWLTCGPADDDLRAFWTAVATALGAVVGEPAATSLRRATRGGGPAAGLPGAVAEAVGHAPGPVVLVVGNLHEITSPEVHASLLQVIETPIPGLRWVLTTRHDPPWPLHRLRLAGLLAEVRAADLAVDAAEGREMFARLGVDLTSAQLDRLLERTEGWAAGLRLAALPMRVAGADVANRVEKFSGDDRAVSAYLLSETLAPQAAPVLRFLERICILDLVCAELADAVTGDGNGAAMLDELTSSNLFVHPVGSGGRWFRLHTLVSDVLRSRRSDPRARRDLHRRAAEWYRRQSLPLPAVRFALRGGLFPLAAELVGLHVAVFVLKSGARDLDTMLSAVDRDVLLTHPELAAGLAAARTVQGHRDEVEELVDAAAARLDLLPDGRRRRVAMVLDLVAIGIARFHGDLEAVVAACRRVPVDPRSLSTLGMSGWNLIRTLTLSNRGAAELWLGDLDAAEEHLRAAAGDDDADGVLPHLNACAHLALLECERGELRDALDHAGDAIARAEAAGSDRSVQVAPAYLAAAWVHLDRGELPDVDHWLGRVDEIEIAAPEPHIQFLAAVLRAGRRAATEPELALRDLGAAVEGPAGPALPGRLRDRGLLAQAAVADRLGDPVLARRVLADLQSPESPEAVSVLAGVDLLEHDADGAARRLGALRPAALRTAVTVDVARALVAAARQDQDEALRLLERALVAAAPELLRRPFTERGADLRRVLALRVERGTSVSGFAVDLLERTIPDVGTPSRGAPDALTARETVVLGYLASALTNAEIADELSVSVNTVKTHQHTVYRKLGVARRREAVRRARELRLL